MTVAVGPEYIEDFLALAQEREVEATIIGEFTDSRHFQFFYNGELLGDISMDFLHGGVPQMQLHGTWNPIEGDDPFLPEPG